MREWRNEYIAYAGDDLIKSIFRMLNEAIKERQITQD